MSSSIANKRYAQAVFQIAKENNQLDVWIQDLTKISTLMSDKDFSKIMENPKVSFETKSNSITRALGKLNPLVLNFCYLLIMKNKTQFASQIAQEYQRLLDNYNEIKRAIVITPVALDKENELKFNKQLEELVDSKVITEYFVDSSIIGGFIARIDDYLIDGSIRNKLEKLKKTISGEGQ